MKILLILHIPPPIHGAAMVGQTIKESRAINTAFDCQYLNLSLSDRVDTIGKNSFGKVLRYFSLMGQMIRQLIAFKPDLCYLTIQIYRIGFYKDLPMALLAKLFGVKVIYHLHNKGVSKWQHRFLDDLLYRMVFKNAEVILLSKTLYSDIQKYVPEERVSYCANGVADEAKGQKSEVKIGRWEDGARETVEILFLSNLTESKGVFVLLEASRLLKNKGLRFHCTFVGGAGDISELQFNDKIVAWRMEETVTYIGQKYGVEKQQLLADSDIFVHPTYNDCFPLVLLEAM